jgi:hypothetical protein
VAALAVIDGKRHRHMADSAKFSIQHPRHLKMFCRLFFDVKDIRVAIVTV